MRRLGILLLAALAGCQVLDPFADAKEAVKRELSDPESAQFRSVRETGDGVFCGEVNSRNRMGGYVGFRPFVVATGKAQISPEPIIQLTDVDALNQAVQNSKWTMVELEHGCLATPAK